MMLTNHRITNYVPETSNNLFKNMSFINGYDDYEILKFVGKCV